MKSAKVELMDPSKNFGWNSAAAHLNRQDHISVKAEHLLERSIDLQEYISERDSSEFADRIGRHPGYLGI